MNDNAFDALASKHRRTLLLALLEENPQEDRTQISPNGGTETLEPEQRLGVAMYHNHLPKLVGYGYIRWNEDTHEIVKGPQFEELRPLLEFVADYAER